MVNNKAIRSALMVARRKRAPGGSLSDAMNNFSQDREKQFNKPAASSTDAALLAMLQQHPQLAVAEPPEHRQTPMTGQVADLGAEVDEGAKWLSGKSDDDEGITKAATTNTAYSHQAGNSPPAVSGSHTSGVKQGNAPALITTDSYSNANSNPDVKSLAAYIYKNAPSYGVDPNLALGIALREGLNSNTISRGGNPDSGGYSYGPFQLFSGGLAPQFHKDTGLDPRDPATQQAQVDWTLGYMRDHPREISNQSSTWMSIKDNGGIGNLSRIGANYANQNSGFEQPTQNAEAAPAPQPARQAPPANFRISDPNPDPLTSHQYPAPTETSGPQPAPQAAPPSAPPSAPPPAQPPQAQADPMSNLYNRVALGPEVQSGYDSPQALFAPDQAQARRGGKIKRADGGEIARMPTNELIDYALNRIRKHRASGGYQPPGEIVDGAILGTAGDSPRMNTMTWEGNAPTQAQAAPAQTPTPQPSGPAVTNAVGNAAGATGAPLGGIPAAQPTVGPIGSTNPNGPQYSNSINQALGTNDPTENQIFGFNYPQVPPPNPQPQGPVSQDAINSAYTDSLLYGQGAAKGGMIRRHRDAGGATQPAPTLGSLNTQVQNLSSQQANQQAQQQAMLNAQIQGIYQSGGQSGGGRSGWGSGPSGAELESLLSLQGSAPASSPQQTPAAPSGPAIPNGQVGNAAAATGSPIGGLPEATPTIGPMGSTNPSGPQYNNSIDQVLGTNNPTENQVFGFNYPQVPPPNPQPQGPVSQDAINAAYTDSLLYGQGAATGGAIIMDAALNRARKALKGNKRYV